METWTAMLTVGIALGCSVLMIMKQINKYGWTEKLVPRVGGAGMGSSASAQDSRINQVRKIAVNRTKSYVLQFLEELGFEVSGIFDGLNFEPVIRRDLVSYHGDRYSHVRDHHRHSIYNQISHDIESLRQYSVKVHHLRNHNHRRIIRRKFRRLISTGLYRSL